MEGIFEEFGVQGYGGRGEGREERGDAKNRFVLYCIALFGVLKWDIRWNGMEFGMIYGIWV